jgi:hypothetical protein
MALTHRGQFFWHTIKNSTGGSRDSIPRAGNTRFSDMPEILPGWNLRLNVQTDGKGYVLLLDDASDKTGFGWVSDERGIIRQCKSLQ